MKKIIVFITHSLGEIDIILPIGAALNSKNQVNIEMFFIVDEFYNKFISNNFYMYCAKKLNIKLHRFQLLNKFDYKKIYDNKLLYYFYKIFFLFKSLFILKHFLFSDIYMHETSNQQDSTNILYFFSNLFNKKIYVYHHGQSINRTTKGLPKRKFADKKLFLVFHNQCKEWANGVGYIHQHTIGLPVYFKEWSFLIKEYYNKLKKQNKHILIFSRGVHDHYMDEDKYIILIESSYKKIRKIYGNIKIIIKPHPRENINLLKMILIKNNMNNIEISNEYSGILAMNSLCVISFWTSAILISLSLKIPSIEYYIEAKNFRLVEYPNGSEYRDPIFGIQCTDQEKELEDFLIKVKSGYNFNYDKVSKNFQTRNLECFD